MTTSENYVDSSLLKTWALHRLLSHIANSCKICPSYLIDAQHHLVHYKLSFYFLPKLKNNVSTRRLSVSAVSKRRNWGKNFKEAWNPNYKSSVQKTLFLNASGAVLEILKTSLCTSEHETQMASWKRSRQPLNFSTHGTHILSYRKSYIMLYVSSNLQYSRQVDEKTQICVVVSDYRSVY